MSSSALSAAVVVATYNRPDHVTRCIEHLLVQTLDPAELVVVDASPNELTREAVASFPGVIYVRNDRGRGHTAWSRHIGMSLTRSEVVAFIDDDAYADQDWLEQLIRRHGSGIGAVGGRAINGVPGEEREGVEEIGRLLDNGVLTGNFAANPGRDIEVDHLLGANMSVRRSAVDAVGGIHDHFPGTCLREETDITLRMRRAGFRIVFTPDAVVHHEPGPYAKGRRFDTRYKYYGARNHAVLLAHSLGLRESHTMQNLLTVRSSVVRDVRSALRTLRSPRRPGERRGRAAASALASAAAHTAGTAVGMAAALRIAALERRTGRSDLTRS